MDIKSLTGLLNLRAGKLSDVKNRGTIGITTDEAATKAKDNFSTILAAEDSKSLPLSTEDSKSTLSAVDFPQQMVLPIPIALLCSDPLPLVLSGNTNDVADGTLFSLPAEALEKRFYAEPHADLGISSVPDLMALPSSLIKSEEIKQLLPTNVMAPIQVDDLPTDTKDNANRTPALNGGPPTGISAAFTDVVKKLTVNFPSPALAISVSAPQQLDRLALAPKNLAKPTINIVNFKDEITLLNPPAAKSILDEAGRKNEALLDVLALGEGRAKPIGGESEIKPAIYTFQREAGAESTLLNQSSYPGQTDAAESSQITEKDNYWGGNGPQNITFTLGGTGDETVAVKILVSGLDTQVDIRTDDQALRQMIEGSVQEMKEKLSSEGLTLSELSVGASSKDQGMSQSAGHGTGRESQRRATPEVLTPQNPMQSSVLKNSVPSMESRLTPVGGQKLSVFV